MAAAIMPPNLAAKLQQAETLFRRGALADASKLCQDVLSLQPMHFAALHLLGVIASQTGQMSQAIQLLGKAIAARPGSADAYNSLGAVLAQLGRPEQAVLSFARAITLKPDFAGAHANHRNTLQELQAAVVSHEAAISPVAAPGVTARWNSPDHCPLCTAAAFRCVDSADEPAIGIAHDAGDHSGQGSVFEC